MKIPQSAMPLCYASSSILRWADVSLSELQAVSQLLRQQSDISVWLEWSPTIVQMRKRLVDFRFSTPSLFASPMVWSEAPHCIDKK